MESEKIDEEGASFVELVKECIEEVKQEETRRREDERQTKNGL